jgi:hypothetical protein
VAYYEDLSDYVYAPGFVRPGTKAVRWLASGHVFPTTVPEKEILDLLWQYCSISVAFAANPSVLGYVRMTVTKEKAPARQNASRGHLLGSNIGSN